MTEEQQPASCRKKLTSKLLSPDILNIILLVLGLGFTAYFFYTWLFLPSWVHFGFVRTTPGYLLKPAESLFPNAIEYGFNLEITEYGYYRPRFLSMFLECLDANLSFKFHKIYPELGIKLPSYAFSIVATVASFVWFWKNTFKKDGYGIAVIGGASLLYFDVFINTSFMVLRGGKFLATAAGLICITFFLRYLKTKFSARNIGACVSVACILLLLATLDEQITALIFFLTAVALIAGCTENTLSSSAVIFMFTSINYCLYYVYWGRLLFDKFTPGGIKVEKHPHNFSDVFNVDLEIISRALEVLYSNFVTLGVSSLVLLIVLAVSMKKIIDQRERRIFKLLISLSFSLFPIALTAAMIASHPSIYSYKAGALWSLFYLLLPCHTLVVAVSYSLYSANSQNGYLKNAMAIAFALICIGGAFKISTNYNTACTSTRQILVSFPCGDDTVFIED